MALIHSIGIEAVRADAERLRSRHADGKPLPDKRLGIQLILASEQEEVEASAPKGRGKRKAATTEENPEAPE